MVLVSILLYRFRKYPLCEMICITVLCGIIEYVVSWGLEATYGQRWWDYTGYFLNLNGRICAEGLLVFALGGMAAVYLLIPIIDGLVIQVKREILIPVCLALVLCFSIDGIYSKFHPNAGKGITDISEINQESELYI